MKLKTLFFCIAVYLSIPTTLLSQDTFEASPKSLDFIAGKIYFGMDSSRADEILRSEFVPIKLGDHILNKATLVTDENKVIGISYQSRLASAILQRTGSGDVINSSSRSQLIIRYGEELRLALLNKGYKSVYESSTRDLLNPFTIEALFILEKDNKVVGFKYIGHQDWDVVMTTKAILNNSIIFKKVFYIPLTQATSDMQDVF